MITADEQELIQQVQDGDHGAFRILVERYMKNAYNVAYGFVGDHDDAQDVAQEAFVRAYRSIGSFRREASFGTWLYRIVSNLSMNHIRRHRSIAKWEVRDADGALGSTAGPSHEHGSPDLKEHLERALHRLPTLQRAVVILRHLNGMSTKQVSSILQCSEGTIKTHLHRGLRKMSAEMGYLKEEL
jgi:RNA polymerase sigma-70 factor, ECF subfamily